VSILIEALKEAGKSAWGYQAVGFYGNEYIYHLFESFSVKVIYMD